MVRKLGIVGSGGIGMGCAAWVAQRGHEVTLWSPRNSAQQLAHEPLAATGALETSQHVTLVADAAALVAAVEVVLVTVPANGHQAVMDSLLPHLRDGQTVIVSSMSSLSSLYLFEQAAKQGIRISVASFGTTVLTARRKSPTLVNVLTRRGSVSVSALPQSSLHSALELCESLFGGVFLAEDNPLVSTLANTNAVTHTPLALLNWTRIEREENWPQYHYMTASVSAIIEKIDAERLAIAEALGFKVRSVEEHFRQSFQIEQKNMAEIAAEMHKRRGGPPGPTDTSTRFLTEDVPFGLVFVLALAKIAGVPAPVTQANVTMASLVADKDFAADNAFIDALGLRGESVGRLLKRVSVA